MRTCWFSKRIAVLQPTGQRFGGNFVHQIHLMMLYNFQIHWRAWFGGPYLRSTNSWGKKQTEKGIEGKGQQLAYGLPPTETSFQKWMTFDHSKVTSVWGSHRKSLPLQLFPTKIYVNMCFPPKLAAISPKTSSNFHHIFWGKKNNQPAKSKSLPKACWY